MVTEEKSATSPEQQPTPVELANNWLDFRKGQVEKKLHSSEQSYDFTKNYEPKYVSRPSNIEPGSLDDSDWSAAEGEARQWPETREEELDSLREEMDNLEDELSQIGQSKRKVAEGDKSVIETFAELEKQRQAEIEEERQKILEKEREAAVLAKGKEMEGADEVYSNLKKLTDLSRHRDDHKKGPKGWNIGSHNYKDKYNDRDQFDFVNENHYQIRVYSDEGQGLSVSITDARNPRYPTEEKNHKDYVMRYWFTVKDGKIYHWGKGELERDWSNGYLQSYYDPKPVGPFEDSDFDEAKRFIAEATSDIISSGENIQS